MIYNFYNLDPKWHEDANYNRVLLMEPSVYKAYPISSKSIEFMLGLSGNIKGIQCYVGEFDELVETYGIREAVFKEHPLNKYIGREEPRDWMFEVTGYYRSFFAFWKKCQRELK